MAPIEAPTDGDKRRFLMENFEIGDIVIARFTEHHRERQFRGEIVGKTKNYWKVECLENFRTDDSGVLHDEIGRVFHIATLASRTYSANNCIARKVG